MFPHMPEEAIRRDLLSTRSVELTIDNILEGRIHSIDVGETHTRTQASQNGVNQDENQIEVQNPNTSISFEQSHIENEQTERLCLLSRLISILFIIFFFN